MADNINPVGWEVVAADHSSWRPVIKAGIWMSEQKREDQWEGKERMQMAESSISNHRTSHRLLQQSLSLQDWAVQPQHALQLNQRLIHGTYSIVF